MATVTFTFSEAPVGFSAADVTYDSSSATLGTLTATADPLVYTASLTPIAATHDAVNVITVGTGWTDAQGNAPSSASTSPNYTIDTVQPSVVVTLDDAAPVATSYPIFFETLDALTA